MRVLLDTFYLFDFMDRPGKFPDSERRILAAAGTELYVSAVSIWEIRLKHNAPPPVGGAKEPFLPEGRARSTGRSEHNVSADDHAPCRRLQEKTIPNGCSYRAGIGPSRSSAELLGQHWLRKYFFSPQSRELTCPALPIGKDSAVEAGHLTALFPKPGCPSSGLYSLAWN